MDKLQQFVAGELDTLRQKGTFYRPRVLQTEQKATVIIDGHEVITLSSNNYLGLTVHPALREAAIQAINKYGVGSGSVRTIAGTMSLHVELEEKLARFKHTEASLTFQSGYTTNLGVISSLMLPEDIIISDELNHASIIDGIRLTFVSIERPARSTHTKIWPGCAACWRNREALAKSWSSQTVSSVWMETSRLFQRSSPSPKSSAPSSWSTMPIPAAS